MGQAVGSFVCFLIKKGMHLNIDSKSLSKILVLMDSLTISGWLCLERIQRPGVVLAKGVSACYSGCTRSYKHPGVPPGPWEDCLEKVACVDMS